MSVKHISQIIGSLGKWQMNICLFYTTIYILSPFNNFGITFHAPNVTYLCSNDVDIDGKNISYRSDSDVCNRCTNWTFDDYYGKTIISEFELVCDKSWLSSFSQSVYQSGYVVNGLLLGYLSDRYGRRPVIWLALAIEICGGLSIVFSQSMTQYIMSKFFLGLGDSGRGVCLYLLILETVGPKYRSDIAMSVSFGWILGYISLPGFSYLLKNFRYIQAIPTVAAIVLMSTWMWTIPESPRWLLANNHIERAHKCIISAAKMNGKTNREEIYEKLNQMAINTRQTTALNAQNEKHYSILDLLSSHVLRKYSLIFWFNFAVNAFIYHGLCLNVGQIGGNLYVNFAIAGVVEIPSIILNIIGLKFMGRKWFTVSTMLLASLAYSAIVALSVYSQAFNTANIQTLKLLLSMIAKLFIFSSFNALYIHSGEVFPTVLRHTGVGSCSIAARVGSILAPFVKEFIEFSNFGLSMLLFALLSLTASVLTLFLPETKDRDIPDSIADVQYLRHSCKSKANENKFI